MSEDFGPTFLTVTDEEGNELVLEFVDALEHEGTLYQAFFPAETEGEEDDPDNGLVILKIIREDGEDVRLNFDQDGKAVEPTAASAENSALGDNPTVRQIYEHYAPMVKNLVLADTAYQNACANSDRDLARLEGNEAIKRAVLAINDTLLLKQYYDNSAFHDRIHQEIISETYTVLSQPQPEQAAESGDQSYGPEFMYRRLNALKSDCEYFLGAGGRNEKHLSEGGSIEKQIAKMRGLYDAVPDKTEWLTADR